MKVLVACEYSGRVRDAFLRRGHDAMSCDLLPTETPGPHYQGDVRDLLGRDWDLMIAHPPCTYLTSAGARYWPKQQQNQREAVEFVKLLFDCGIVRVAIENPVGVLSTLWRKPTQIVHPYYFGDGELKRTCLWLCGLKPLKPTMVLPKPEPTGYCVKANGRRYNYYFHQSKSGHERSRTFVGIAEAMAAQWGGTIGSPKYQIG